NIDVVDLGLQRPLLACHRDCDPEWAVEDRCTPSRYLFENLKGDRIKKKEERNEKYRRGDIKGEPFTD
ncbi:MAG: hypothetical protein ABEI86_02180, partial [Halobacteriaceae archaeon]